MTWPPTPSFLRRVAEQQADQGAFLWVLRTRLAARAGTRLAELRRVDARLGAHLDGLALAGRDVWPLCRKPLARPAPGETFLATAVALGLGDEGALADCLRRGRSRVPGAVRGAPWAREVAAAFEWAADVDPAAGARSRARGADDLVEMTLASLASSERATHRLASVVARARLTQQRRAPAHDALGRALYDPHSVVRARAARGVAEVGLRAVGNRADVFRRLRDMADADVASAAHRAAWALVQLGARDDVPAPAPHLVSAATCQAPSAESDAAPAWRDALAHGTQRERRRAAWLLARTDPTEPLFPTSAPAARQDAMLDASRRS